MTRRKLEYAARAGLSFDFDNVLLEVVDYQQRKELAVEVRQLVGVAIKERKEEEPPALVLCWDPFERRPFSYQRPRRHGCGSFDQIYESHDLGQMKSQNAAVSVRQLTSLCDDQFVTLFPRE